MIRAPIARTPVWLAAALLGTLSVFGLAVRAEEARPAAIHVLPPADHDLYVRAFAAAAKGDWNNALALGNQGQDTNARQLLQWRYALDQASGAKFADIDAALKMAADWPLKATLYARAEQAIPPDMPPGQIIAWFASRNPSTSLGKVRLGEALMASGDSGKGATLIRDGWRGGSFDLPTETAILAKDSLVLTQDDDRARLDGLLWRGEITAAKRELKRVDGAAAAIGAARIALASGLLHAKPLLARLSDTTDPGLLFDWTRQLRLDNQDSDAHALIMRIDPGTLARDHTQRWWAEVNAQARDLLAAGDPRGALAMVDHATLPLGDEYAEQQFLAGFISLRFLRDPQRALTYFRNLGANVSRPISKSRAEYWQARAFEAMDDKGSAYVHYRFAAQYPETFYGQLALARTSIQPLLHPTEAAITAAPKEEVEGDALMPQMRVLADLGLADDLRLFAERDQAAYPAPAHQKQLLQTLTDWGYPDIALRLAKNASYAGLYLPSFAYPVLRLPGFTAPGQPPQPALVHALIRQETEFNPAAVSSAGARGLMQVMPASARVDARQGGLPYQPGALLTDPDYNIQLGMIEYARYLANWGGSNVLAAAAYNAGPTNMRRWLANGDPRTGADPIDWIEEIPFSETRNYVQRVLENMEVYRSRLAGRDMPLMILADLYAPLSPPQEVLTAPVSATSTRP
jgi:soluble lytic murein transglycosylase